MKAYLRILSAMLLSAVLFSSCTIMGERIRPSKNYITRNYKVKDFVKIDGKTVGDVYYTQSKDGTTSVQIYGPDNIVDLIQVAVKNNTLILDMENRNRVKNVNKLKISISSPTLEGYYFHGVGDLNIEEGLTTDKLDIENKGVGDVKINSLTCNEINVNSMGVGDVKLNGTAKKANLRSKGVGNITASDLQAEEVEASSSGVGDISCYATESLTASVKGVGSINYKGNPQKKQFKKQGVGSIKNI